MENEIGANDASSPEHAGGPSEPESVEPQLKGEHEAADEAPKEESAQITVSELAAMKKELLDASDQKLRIAAEMENMRRRHSKEKEDLTKFANEKVMHDLLSVLDSFDKALGESGQSDGDKEASFLEGFQMVQKQLLDCLRKHGLEAVDAEGADFDPNIHQAIQKQESEEVDRDKVNQVFAKGYSLHGRLVRPAMVSVHVPSGKS